MPTAHHTAPNDLPCRLEGVNDVEKIFFKDEGGQTSSLCFGYVVRFRHDATPEMRERILNSKPSYQLFFAPQGREGPKEVKNSSRINRRKVKCDTFEIITNLTRFDKNAQTGIVHFRVNNIISKGNGNFCLRVLFEDTELDPLFSNAFEVRSKRKLIGHDRRVEENHIREVALKNLEEYLFSNAMEFIKNRASMEKESVFRRSFIKVLGLRPVHEMYPSLPVKLMDQGRSGSLNSLTSTSTTLVRHMEPSMSLNSLTPPGYATLTPPSSAPPSPMAPVVRAPKVEPKTEPMHQASSSTHRFGFPTVKAEVKDEPLPGVEAMCGSIAELDTTMRLDFLNYLCSKLPSATINAYLADFRGCSSLGMPRGASLMSLNTISTFTTEAGQEVDPADCREPTMLRCSLSINSTGSGLPNSDSFFDTFESQMSSNNFQLENDLFQDLDMTQSNCPTTPDALMPLSSKRSWGEEESCSDDSLDRCKRPRV